jgi:RNA 2',3'-cyclic 3'-phosphodiesterase
MTLRSDHTRWRVFLAVRLPPPLIQAVAELQQQLRGTLPTVNWVSSDSIHLTLKFLGYIDTGMVDRLLTVIEPIGRNQTSFKVEIQGLGAFPHAQRPRILWVGCAGDISSLLQLVSEIDCALEPLGFPPEEKVYHPHLTLARIKHENSMIGNVLAHSDLLEQSMHLGPLPIDHLTLFRSDVSHVGAEYTPLWTVQLN